MTDLGSGDEPAATGQRLGERPHDQVGPDPGGGRGPGPPGPDHAEGVGLVDEQPGAEVLCRGAAISASGAQSPSIE